MRLWLLLLPALASSVFLRCNEAPCRAEDPACSLEAGLALLSSMARARYGFSDSGQLSCYDTAGAVISCADTNWPRQDGFFISPRARRFLGPVSPTEYPSDFITTDQVTQLVWTTCALGQSGANCATGSALFFTNDGGVGSATDQCGTLNSANGGAGYAGLQNWRLPSIDELISINDYGRSSPSMDPTFFPGSTSGFYWSNTPDANAPGNQFTLQLIGGFADSVLESNPNEVRCVSGAPASRPSFLVFGPGTVTDQSNGLMWQRCVSGQTADTGCSGAHSTHGWQAALQYCANLNLAGFSDWRLPSVVELNSVLDRNVSAGIDEQTFPTSPALPLWTSTTVLSTTNNAWRVEFPDAIVSSDYDKTDTYPVRCVRSF
ncbi:MAG: DUF1566 domain-containing protein [Leptospiraceae bacterium]|nr:DUF1566 domain-containing protein [Leptospiraceae bacterium]